MVELHDAVPTSSLEGWTKGRIAFIGISSAIVLVLLTAVREVLLPFVLGAIIAYVLTPLVAWGETRLRLPRSLSIVIVYVLVLGTVVMSATAMAPRIYEETTSFVREVPKMARKAAKNHGPRLERWVNNYQATSSRSIDADAKAGSDMTVTKKGADYSVTFGTGVTVVEEGEGHWLITGQSQASSREFQVSELVDESVESFINYVQINAFQFIKVGQAIVTGLSRGILLLFMTLMVAGYLMHTRENVLAFFRSLVPRMHRPGFDFLLKRMDRGLSGVVRGQLLICIVNGILSAVGFAFFGLKYWPVLALLAAVMSIIPIFGSILSTVPAVFVGLTQDVWTALWVLIWILGIHQVEANFLNPKIIGVAARLHPVLIVFSLLVGEHFFGLWGALLAVPALSIAQSVFNHFRFSLPDVESDSLAAPELINLGLDFKGD